MSGIKIIWYAGSGSGQVSHEQRILTMSMFYKSKEGEEDMFKSLVINYFKNKVEGCKQQDRVAKREIDEEQYIDEIGA